MNTDATLDTARELAADPAELLVRLLRFDTRNPPGDERALMDFLTGLLRASGLEVRTVAADPERPNLIVRLPGTGEAPPLLLHAHVDVVGVEDQTWTHDPFSGVVEGGMVWGRGALDMKGGVAMLVAAVLRAAQEGIRPRGDVILALMADEEVKSDLGARFLVEQHPELFAGVRYAIGEFGGFTQTVAGRSFAMIQVSEKRRVTVRMSAHGPGGHGSLGTPNAALLQLSKAIVRLERRGLPIQIDPVTERMVAGIAAELPRAQAAALSGLLRPPATRTILRALGAAGRSLAPLLADTAVPTVARAGSASNVVPSTASVVLDGRILPGSTTDGFLAALRKVSGLRDLEVLEEDPPVGPVDWGLYAQLAGLLRVADPASTPVPMLLAGVTDGRYFSRLGIQHYGFLPMPLPADLHLPSLIHAADERVPAAAIAFGTTVVTDLLRQYGSAPA